MKVLTAWWCKNVHLGTCTANDTISKFEIASVKKYWFNENSKFGYFALKNGEM